MQALKFFLSLAVLLALGYGFIILAGGAIEKAERGECIKLEKQASEYDKWWSTAQEREQCAHYGIYLPASVGRQ